MGVDLGRMEVRRVVILPLAGQRPIDAIINIGPNYQWIFAIVVLPNFGFFFGYFTGPFFAACHIGI